MIFLGNSLTGKSRMIELVIELSQRLKDNPLVKEIFLTKIYPKAYNNDFLFTETDKFSKLQFYSNFKDLIYRCVLL